MQYSTVQYSTVQHRTVQYSTAQYSTAQYSTVHIIQYRENDTCRSASLLCAQSDSATYFKDRDEVFFPYTPKMQDSTGDTNNNANQQQPKQFPGTYFYPQCTRYTRYDRRYDGRDGGENETRQSKLNYSVLIKINQSEVKTKYYQVVNNMT